MAGGCLQIISDDLLSGIFTQFKLAGIHRKDLKYFMKPANLSNNQRVYDVLVNSEKLPSTCLLCIEGELCELGHIIPKFVMRFLKSASNKSTFYLNNTKTKAQDTLALRILCKNCENRFSHYEKFFVDKFFKKYYRKREHNGFGEEVYYFALSVAWRIMASTPIMKGEDSGDQYYRALRDSIRSHLIDPKMSVEADVYIFLANDVAANMPAKDLREDFLNFSVRQGIFAHTLVYDGTSFNATVAPLPLVHFKLGAYYFIVARQDHLHLLTFHKKIEPSEHGQIHLLRYSEELVGFLHHISNGGFLEVVESAIPTDGKYNRVQLP